MEKKEAPHSCPVCRCQYDPRYSGSAVDEMRKNVERMAKELAALRKTRRPT